MPKDWDTHKAEIERLYMVEQLPLKDVRNILRTQHAFDASIRSYRMKLDEWRMWKNNSKTERRKTKTISRRRQPRAVPVSESLDEASSTSALPPPVDISGSTGFDSFYRISIPRGSLDIAELLPMLSGFRDRPECGLELMLDKWRPDGSYLKAAMNYLRENKANFRINFYKPCREGIFRDIDEVLAPSEKYPLAKMCLTVDFEQFQHEGHGIRDIFPEWMRVWREACVSQTWKAAKERLDSSYHQQTFGSLFVPTALCFLAAKLLEKNLRKLEQWRDGVGLIGIFPVDEEKVCRQESMDILGYFKDAPDGDYDLDPIWYKRFFQFYEPYDTEYWGKELQLGQLREYRQKFSQLKILHDSASSPDGLVPNLLSAANVLKESKLILDTVQCEDVQPTNEDPSQHPSTPIVVQGSQRPRNKLRMLLDDVYESWAVEHDIQKNVDCLRRHLKSFGISNPLSPEENVFILISQTIPANNQVRFTLDVLKAITDSRYQSPKLETWYDWDTWIAVRDSSTLKSLTENVAKEFVLPIEIILSLDDRIQLRGVKLILDAFTGLVGENQLFSLKGYIKRHHASGLPYPISLDEYKSILDTLHQRKIKVNQDLFAFLGRVFVWESIDKNGDKDEEGRMLFDSSSDDESNNSESESLESEIESEE